MSKFGFRRVVVVEANRLCREAIVAFLERLLPEDATVVAFASAGQVGGQLERSDLIISNVGAPQDEQNLETILKRVKTERIAVPIIAMSCGFFTSDDLVEKARALGVSACLIKPYVRDELKEALRIAQESSR